MKPKTSQNRKPAPLPAPVGLVGQYFHPIDKVDNQVCWQGVVIGNLEPGWYLVQVFDWFLGEANDRHLVHIESMANWLFYADADSMNYSFDHGTAREGGPHQRRTEPFLEPQTKAKAP